MRGPGAWPYYKQYSPDLDLLAVNSYGHVCQVKQDWINGGYNKPYILTEGGPAGEWEVPNDANGVPNEPTDIQKRDGYLAGLELHHRSTRVSPSAPLCSTTAVENDFGAVWFNLTPGGEKRLSYYAVRQALRRSASGGNTRTGDHWDESEPYYGRPGRRHDLGQRRTCRILTATR